MEPRSWRTAGSARRAGVLAAALMALGCGSPTAPQGGAGPAAPASSLVPRAAPPVTPRELAIPAGSLAGGTPSGAHGRVPRTEPRPFTVDLGPYSIDALPYPNQPAAPPALVGSREDALSACAAAGKRLCTEAEWERACRGPDQFTWSTGTAWSDECLTAPSTCASGFGLLGAGVFAEWTASDVVLEGRSIGVAIRGADAGEGADARRCARRRAAAPSGEPRAFRCCGGAVNAARVPEAELGAPFERVELPREELSALLASDPITAALATDLAFFLEPDASREVVRRGDASARGLTVSAEPVLWRPVAGSEILLVTARSGKATSFVVAYWVDGPSQRRLAASFIMEREAGPVALLYDAFRGQRVEGDRERADVRPRLSFSTCWGCLGESGRIVFGDPESVRILQP